MRSEKISDKQKQNIAKLGLYGKQFKYMAESLNVSETTVRKADKIGSLKNRIEEVETLNRMQEIQLTILKTRKPRKLKISKRS